MTFIEGPAAIEGHEKATCRRHGLVMDYMYPTFNFCATLVGTGNGRVVGSFDLDEGGRGGRGAGEWKEKNSLR